MHILVLIIISDGVGIDGARARSPLVLTEGGHLKSRAPSSPSSRVVLPEEPGDHRSASGDMQLLIGPSQLLLALVLQLAPAQVNMILQTRALFPPFFRSSEN